MTLESLSLTLSDLAPALKNHLWQSTIFLLAAALLTLALRHNHARTRYWLWLAASIKFLIPFSLLITLGSHLATPRPVAPTQTTVYFAMEEVSQPFAPIVIPIDAPAPLAKHPTHILPIVLAAVWVAGFATVLAIWFVYWRRITAALRTSTPVREGRELEILRRLEHAAGLRKRIQLLASPSTLGPGIYGIARPILLWPAAISQRLDDAHLESIFAHEICHVRRRDNLTAALHMLVEAIFWFHPLVWALGARLEAERERACDESVLENSPALTTHPHIYAESIVKICEFYVESPLPCVSGVTGADLKKRLTDILERHATLKLTFAKKLLITGIGITFIAIPILSGQAKAMQRLSSFIHTSPRRFIPASLIAPAAIEQSPDIKTDLQEVALSEPLGLYGSASAIPTEPLKFSIVSTAVKPSPRACPSFGVTPNPDGISVDCLTVTQMMEYAYGLPANTSDRLIVGAPKWADTTNFDIQTKLADETVAALKILPEDQQQAQHQLLLQSLLETHFQLKAHRETRDTPVYTLVVAKSGLKLKEAIPGQPDIYGMTHNGAPVAPGISGITVGNFMGHAVTVSKLANALNLSSYSELDRIVVDKTGLTQNYDFDLKWAWTPKKAGQDAVPGPPIFTAVQDQLGLELESTTSPLETLVIDYVEQPGTQGQAAAIQPPAAAQLPDTPPVFEVATIKLTDESPGVMHMISPQVFPGGRHIIIINGHTLKGLIGVAWHVGYWQIPGGEGWMDKTRFDLEAIPSEEWVKKITNIRHSNSYIEDENICRMLQALLIDRFQLKVHVETKTGKVLLLEQGPGGAKMQPTKATETEHPGVPAGFGGEAGRNSVYNISMPQLAKFAGDVVFHQPVIDHTGLTGSFDYKRKVEVPFPPAQEGDLVDMQEYTDNFQQLIKEMGLKFTPSTGPVETLVIDHADKPSPN